MLVGHDLGGGVAQIAAARAPERFSGLVLTNALSYDSWQIPGVKVMARLAGALRLLPDVTRIGIADVVEHAFDHPPASRSGILQTAAAMQASPELLAVLERLPDRDYRTLRDLWPHLGSVPVVH